MPTPAVLLLNFVLALLPQANGGRIDAFLQAVPGITDSLDQIADGVARGPLLQRTKATLLEGYGMVLTLELRLDDPPSPFASRTPVENARRLTAARLRTLKDDIVDFMKEALPGLSVISPTESLTVVVYVLNTNPVDLPHLPTQVLLAVTRQDALDLSEGRISSESFRARVRITEY